MRMIYTLAFMFFLIECTTEGNDLNSDSGTQVGSYSTMMTIGQKLYIVNKTSIYTYNIIDVRNPVEINRQDVGFDIESLYHHDGLLLIGSANNMYIFRINDRGIPERESTTSYFEAFENIVCQHDPIVAKSNIAYITLSAQTSLNFRCTRTTNELRVYDITKISKPVLLNTIQMSGPKGLGLGKKSMFVCDIIDGLVVFNIENPLKPIKSIVFKGFIAFDVIVRGNLLIVVAKDSLMQYDISDESNIKFVGKIDL